jgi:hypothetical protein
MAAAQRKRWAALKAKVAAAATPVSATAARKKRHLIPEGRVRIIAATKTSRRRISTEGGWPDEGGGKATGTGEGARREGGGAGDGGSGGERAGRRHGIADRRETSSPGTALPTTPYLRNLPADGSSKSRRQDR